MGDQFGSIQKSSNDLQHFGRKVLHVPMNMMSFQRPRNHVFPGDLDEDNEATQLFNNAFRLGAEKDIIAGTMPAPSTSLLPSFGQAVGFHTPATSLTLPQRPIGSGHFRNSAIMPGPPFLPMAMQQTQQAHSPNSLPAIGARNMLMNQTPTGHMAALSKRPSSVAGFGSGQGGPMSGFLSLDFGSNRSNHFDTPSLDMSDFPSLSSRSNAAPNTIVMHRTYGTVSKPSQDTVPEFNISQEEFPALPGLQNPPVSSDAAFKNPTGALSGFNPMSSRDGPRFLTDRVSNCQISKSGIQMHPDGTVTNIPSGMLTDQFGIVGLLTFIRAADQDRTFASLFPGIDLTVIGLNLNQRENLYSTFQSPWADGPCRPQDIDYHVPAEYLTNIIIREKAFINYCIGQKQLDSHTGLIVKSSTGNANVILQLDSAKSKLAPIKLNRYGDDLLFFLFYTNGGDVLQLAAAVELYNRDWRYHKEERVWMTRFPNTEPVYKTSSSERGTYYFFDSCSWRKVAKEFHLIYDKLEERPSMPQTLQHNPHHMQTVFSR